MPPEVAVADPAARRKQRAKIFGLRSFMEPGNPIDFRYAFGDNVRQFLRECSDVEEQAMSGMRMYCSLLVDEKSGLVVPLYTVEEYVRSSLLPFCDYCRCNGWSHHLVSKRRYHFIVPADSSWDKPLDSDAFNLQTHLLHGLVHCNGFGHLIWINGHEGGSTTIPGHDLMDLWERLCTSLRARAVTVEDLSSKRSMDLRLLLGVAHGTTWFGRWGYQFCMGSYGVTRDMYLRAIDLLASIDIDGLIADTAKFGRDRGELRRVVAAYRKIRRSDPALRPPLVTTRDLLCYQLELKRRAPTPTPTPPPPPKPSTPALPKKSRGEKRKRCRDFALMAAELASRWPVRRLQVAAQVIVDALKDHGWMTRQEVRDAARLTIGDTGLLDFVLKSVGNCIVGGHIIRRAPNPATRVLEFSIDEVGQAEEEKSLSLALVPVAEAEWPSPSQVEQDMKCVYRSLMAGQPEATRVVLDSKHWMKSWGLRDEEDELLRFQCIWMPSDEEMKELTRALPPPVVVVVKPYASVGDLRMDVERAMRDTYCIMEGFRSVEVVGADMDDEEPVFGCGLESGAVVWVKGEGVDMESELRYEGGADTWAVGCACGARDDDGERMVACDACDVWHHTRCIGIADGEAVPPLFLCTKCGSAIVEADAVVVP